MVGNTPIVSASRVRHGFREFLLQTTKPLPTYLIALTVGPLDIVDGGVIPANRYRSHSAASARRVREGQRRAHAYALSLTPRIVTALENYFGVGYPYAKLDIIAVPDFGPGAMENAAAVTFRERYLLLDSNAPVELRRGSLSVQAHELAHQWFGDLVTPVWWDDVWLNESLANWMEGNAAAAVLPEMEFDTDIQRDAFDVMEQDELPSGAAYPPPVGTTKDNESAYSQIIYDKGAAVLGLFEAYAGADAWRRGIHAYLTKYAYGNATAQDFIQTVTGASGHPELTPAFNDFIASPGFLSCM